MTRMTMTALACAASLAMAAPAHAQDASDGASAGALVLIPLKLTKVSDLDFGMVVPTSTPGTITIPADGSARSVTGGVVTLTNNQGFRAEFATAATAGQEVLFLLTAPATLDSAAGDSIPVLALTMDGPNIRNISEDGSLHVGIGGVLSIAADQPVGDYEGEFNLYAEYR